MQAFSFPSGVFAGTKISPESLVQTLKVDEPSDVTISQQSAGEHKGGFFPSFLIFLTDLFLNM